MSNFVKDQVVELFGEGQLFCAETVLKIIADAGGEDSVPYIRMATGFCSGVSRTCGQCGAVSGAIMGIGLFAGRTEPGGEYEPAYVLVQDFLDRFTKKCGSINCYELVGCDFSTPEGREQFKEKGLIQDCVQYAVVAIETALELLREHGYISQHKELINARLGPCGLSCGQCLAFMGGPIQSLSSQLSDNLGDNFAEYAKRFEAMNPVFENYDSFKDMLDFFASGSCAGCREHGCLFKDCRVTSCIKEHGVDFCFQCDEFPCDRHGMPAGLAERWKSNNEAMKEKGVEAWYCGCKDRPRYP